MDFKTRNIINQKKVLIIFLYIVLCIIIFWNVCGTVSEFYNIFRIILFLQNLIRDTRTLVLVSNVSHVPLTLRVHDDVMLYIVFIC